jgi:O-antigen/teichoic acid export membrane protein
LNFKNKTIIAFFWASGQQIATLVLNLTVSILLARILDPVEFGLIGMITIFVSLGTALMNGGLTSSLIRTKDPKDIDFSTVFYTNVVFSLIIYTVIFFSSPLIASFFERPELTYIVRVYALSIIIFSFSAVQLAKLTKELKFKKTMAIQLPSILMGGIVGIAMALLGYGVWSLVIMYLAQAIANSIQFWFRSGWKPKLEYSFISFKEHFGFGFKLALSGVLNSIYSNIYNLVIGKYFSAQQLGYYTRSYTLAQIPVYNLQEVLDRVTYPLLSKIQDDDEKLKSTYKQIIQSVLLLILPILILGIILAEPLFSFFLTDKWLPAVPYFRLICVAGIFVPLSKNNLNILKIKGKSGLFLRLGMMEKMVITIGIFFIIPFGIKGLLYFQIATGLGAFLMNGYFSGRLINYSLVEQIGDVLKVTLLASLTGIIVWFIYSLIMSKMSSWGVILFCSFIFISFYLLMIFIFDKKILNNFRRVIFR